MESDSARASGADHSASKRIAVVDFVGESGIIEVLPPVIPTRPKCEGVGQGTQYSFSPPMPSINLYGGGKPGALVALDTPVCGDACRPGGGGRPRCKIVPVVYDDVSGGGGCTTCGGGGGGGAGNLCRLMQAPSMGLMLDFRPQNAFVFGGGFAPGFELNGFGSWVHVAIVDDVPLIQVNDTNDGVLRNCFDDAFGSSVDGSCLDELKNYKSVELLDGGINGSLTTAYGQ